MTERETCDESLRLRMHFHKNRSSPPAGLPSAAACSPAHAPIHRSLAMQAHAPEYHHCPYSRRTGAAQACLGPAVTRLPVSLAISLHRLHSRHNPLIGSRRSAEWGTDGCGGRAPFQTECAKLYAFPRSRGKTSATSANSVGQTPPMRAVDLEVAVIMCGTGLGALLSSPATAGVKLTYWTPSGGLGRHSAASVPIHPALRGCG